jgi:hypothetical protein
MRKTITFLASTGVLALAAVLFTGTSSGAAGQAPGPSGYHVIKTVPVGGEGFWDYLAGDSEARRLYISHGTHVQVMDVDTDTIVGDIPDTQGVHGIALAPELGRGFTSNGRTSTVTIFDLKTLKTLGTANTGTNPDAIVYDGVTKRVFTMNGRSSDATAINAADGTVAGKVDLNGRPEFAVADGKGLVECELASLPAVREVRREAGGVALTVGEPHITIPALLNKLQSQGHHLMRLTTRHASLEDVFVHLTGRHLRDEEVSSS